MGRLYSRFAKAGNWNRASVWVLALCGTLLLCAGCARKKERALSIEDIQSREGVPVRALVVARGRLLAVERSGGTIEGYSQADLSAGVPGVLSSVKVKVGRKVAKGAVVARVKPDVPSPYATAKAAYEQASKSRERVLALAQEGGVSQETLDQVETGYTMAREQYAAARRSEFVIAPFAGTVIEIFTSVNSKLGPGDAVVQLADLRRVRVTLTVNEAFIGKYAPGQQAFVVTDGDTVFGKVDKVPIGAKEEGHNFPVDVVFPNEGQQFRPGMFVTVHVVVTDRAEVLLVPEEIVLSDGGGDYVYVVDSGVAHQVRVVLGESGQGQVEMVSGLEEGLVVVTEGASLLSDGVKVKVVDGSANR